jgi:hypothetical protein
MVRALERVEIETGGFWLHREICGKVLVVLEIIQGKFLFLVGSFES